MIRRPKAPALFSLPQPPQIESVPFARPASLAPYPKTVMTLLGKNKDSPLEQCLLRDGDGSEDGVWRLVILVSLLHVFTSDLDRRSSLSLLTFTGRDATNLRRPLLRHA